MCVRRWSQLRALPDCCSGCLTAPHLAHQPVPIPQPFSAQWEDAWAAWKQSGCPPVPLERRPAEAPAGAADADLSVLGGLGWSALGCCGECSKHAGCPPRLPLSHVPADAAAALHALPLRPPVSAASWVAKPLMPLQLHITSCTSHVSPPPVLALFARSCARPQAPQAGLRCHFWHPGGH